MRVYLAILSIAFAFPALAIADTYKCTGKPSSPKDVFPSNFELDEDKKDSMGGPQITGKTAIFHEKIGQHLRQTVLFKSNGKAKVTLMGNRKTKWYKCKR